MRNRLTDKELKLLLQNIVIIVDSDEKENKHITDYFNDKRRNISFVEEKLNYGDYSGFIESNENTRDIIGNRNLYFDDVISIERKANLTELANNLKQNSKTNERSRIEREFLKAKKDGCYITIFIEDQNYIQNLFKKQYGKIDSVTGAYVTDFNPNSFYASIKAFEARFGYVTVGYSKRQMGHEIYNTIKYFIREKLK